MEITIKESNAIDDIERFTESISSAGENDSLIRIAHVQLNFFPDNLFDWLCFLSASKIEEKQLDKVLLAIDKEEIIEEISKKLRRRKLLLYRELKSLFNNEKRFLYFLYLQTNKGKEYLKND